jgi:hypothetical protein
VLIPRHLDHEPRLGIAFLLATAALLVVVAALTWDPSSRAAGGGAALLLTGLIATYAMSARTGIPWLASAAEPVDGIGIATKAVEAVGLLFSISLLSIKGGRRSLTQQEVTQ